VTHPRAGDPAQRIFADSAAVPSRLLVARAELRWRPVGRDLAWVTDPVRGRIGRNSAGGIAACGRCPNWRGCSSSSSQARPLPT